MTEVQQLARFASRARYEAISQESVRALKMRILDSLGCAIGAMNAEPVHLLRIHTQDFGGRPLATLIGGGRSAPDRAAFYNGALIRYLDFMDSYLAEGETNHPSDNLSAVLAGAEYADTDGRDLLTALAVAYQVHTRLSDVAPVRQKGFDHTTQGAYAVAAGVARAMGMDKTRTAHALSISGTSNIALRVTRTGSLSHWKGLAYPNTAFMGTHAAFLAMRGITGPAEVFEGNKGFRETIAGPFEIDWQKEGLDRVDRTIIKKYDAEIHAQSVLEGVLELKSRHGFEGADVRQVEIDIFEAAYHIIGGGEEGDKTAVRTREEADHSLPYMVAAALLDGGLMPEQYAPQRILADDVQALLQRIRIRPDAAFSERFPDEMPCRLAITLNDGRRLASEKSDYEGFHTRPMTWGRVVDKFHRLAEPFTDRGLREAIIGTVDELERFRAGDLCSLLEKIHWPYEYPAGSEVSRPS